MNKESKTLPQAIRIIVDRYGNKPEHNDRDRVHHEVQDQDSRRNACGDAVSDHEICGCRLPACGGGRDRREIDICRTVDKPALQAPLISDSLEDGTDRHTFQKDVDDNADAGAGKPQLVAVRCFVYQFLYR